MDHSLAAAARTVTGQLVSASLALMVGATALVAQQAPPPLFSASWDVLPYSAIADPRPIPAEENVDVLVNNPRIAVNLPVRIGDGAAFVSTLSYSQLAFSYRDVAFVPSGAPDELHDLAYRATVTLPVADLWRLTTSAQIGLSSDFENIDGDHWRFQGALVASRRFGEANTFGLGAAYRNDFGEPLVLPVLNLRAQLGGVRVDIQAPRIAAAFVELSDRVEAGLQANVEGGYYRLGGAPGEGDRVKYSVLSLGPALNVDLAGATTLRITTGATLARRFEVQDDTASELREIDLEAGLFARFSLEYRPFGDER